MFIFNNLACSNSWIPSAKQNLERVYQHNYFNPAQVARTISSITITPEDNSTIEVEFGDILFESTQLPLILPVRRGRGRPSTNSVLTSTFPEIINIPVRKLKTENNGGN